jgi:amidase
MGFVSGLPVGVSFFGRAWSEPVLIKFAYAYEQATHLRRPPQFRPTVVTRPGLLVRFPEQQIPRG